MMISRKVLSLAVLVGGWSILSPTFAEAKTRPANNNRLRALVSARQTQTQTQNLSPDLGFGQVPVPLLPRQVSRFLQNYFNRPPGRISPQLRANPFSAGANARRAFALEVFRERALLKVSGVAGGVFFSAPQGTAFTPVSANNFLQRLPIFRVLGIF